MLGPPITRRSFSCALAALAACNSEETGDRREKPAASGRALAADVRDFLIAAKTFELVAVYPLRVDASARPEGVIDVLQSYGVVGRATVESEDERKEAADAIDMAIESSDGTVAACFNPRHGVSATRGAERKDLLICFECHSMRVFSGAEESGSYLIGRRGELELGALFRKHNLTLSSR